MSSMKVVHIAGGCVSGSPLRIVNALNKHTSWKASLVNTMKEDARSFFDIGICWKNQKEKAIERVREADIIHAHGIKVLRELRPFLNSNASIVFHAHGVPTPGETRELSSLGAKIISILQYPERYVPDSRLLPNIVTPENQVSSDIVGGSNARIFYSPTFRPSSWAVSDTNKRWLTKGNGETIGILRRIKERAGPGKGPVDVRYVRDTSFEECMNLKRSSNIVIDDTVTGSYHLVGLESLAMGIPTLGFIDARMERILKSMTGAESLPWVNTRIEGLEGILNALICDPALRCSLGERSYRWMQDYYREDLLIQHFVEAYEDLLNNPETFSTVRFDASDRKAQWFVRDSYDRSYLSRKCKAQRGFRPNVDRDDFERSILSDSIDSNKILSCFWIKSREIPFGSWLYEKRHCRGDGFSELFHEKRSNALLSNYRMALPYARGARVADLGSGTGYGVRLIKEEGGAQSVVGVERDMVATAYAQEVHSIEGVSYLESDMMHSGFPDNSFDLITAIDLIEWIDCDASLIAECIRLLAPGGTLVISGGDFWNKESEVFYKRRYTPQSFKNLLNDWFGSVQCYRQIGHGSDHLGAFIPESACNAPLKEGESLMAVCSL